MSAGRIVEIAWIGCAVVTWVYVAAHIIIVTRQERES